MNHLKAYSLFALIIFGNIALVAALGLKDNTRTCARGRCASGTAIIASMFLVAEIFVGVAVAGAIAKAKNRKREGTRLAAHETIAKGHELSSDQLKAMTPEERFQHFMRQVEVEGKTRIKTG